MNDKTNRSESLRRTNLRTALVIGLIAVAGFIYTIVRGFIK
ncbi:MAG: hypothetical protein ACYDDO_13350 [Acidiferrobacterales bacterium]